MLAIEECDGACSRAYYAMFDAARAALLHFQPDSLGARAKTHKGLISAFGQHIIVTAILPVEFGTAFGTVEKMRLLADYTGDEMDIASAARAVELAETFVAAVKATLALVPPPAPV